MRDSLDSVSGLAAGGSAVRNCILWAGALLMFVAASAWAWPAPQEPARNSGLPLNWPVAPLTKSQIESVKQCDIANLLKQRYPETVKADALGSAFEVRSDCDRAVLALAYAARSSSGESLSEAAKLAYSQAVSSNVGFALATPLFFAYVDNVPLVKAPPFAAREVTDVEIRYTWGGLGMPVDYSVEIHQANAAPVMRVTTGAAPNAKAPADKKILQALGSALADLVPVQTAFRLSPCTDNNPSWTIVLTYADKTTVRWKTDSNLIGFGGPWFAVIGDQPYIQVSSAFPQALGEAIREMKLPIGEPAGMTCGGGVAIFEKAYPPN